MGAHHVLIVDPDSLARSTLQRVLADQGLRVSTSKPQSALGLLRGHVIAVVVVHWNLKFVRLMRLQGIATPTLVYTSRIWTKAEYLDVFDAGADQLMSLDPMMHIPELLARIERCACRLPIIPNQGVIAVNNLMMDLCQRRVVVRKLDVCLSKGEFNMLAWLCINQQTVVPYGELVYAAATSTRSIASPTHAVHNSMSRLRYKLPAAGIRIENVAGVGYRMTPA